MHTCVSQVTTQWHKKSSKQTSLLQQMLKIQSVMMGAEKIMNTPFEHHNIHVVSQKINKIKTQTLNPCYMFPLALTLSDIINQTSSSRTQPCVSTLTSIPLDDLVCLLPRKIGSRNFRFRDQFIRDLFESCSL